MNNNYIKFILLLTFTGLFSACSSGPKVELTSTKKNAAQLINGHLLPDIVLPNVNGSETSLSSLKGKIVLVEFWASWCLPCRVKHPKLNEIYQQYNKANFIDADAFEIYYVNLDDDKKKWIKAMDKDGIANWTYHVADLAGMKKSPIPEQFGFEQIPTAFLLNEKGLIIGKDMSEERLITELKHRLQ